MGRSCASWLAMGQETCGCSLMMAGRNSRAPGKERSCCHCTPHKSPAYVESAATFLSFSLDSMIKVGVGVNLDCAGASQGSDPRGAKHLQHLLAPHNANQRACRAAACSCVWHCCWLHCQPGTYLGRPACRGTAHPSERDGLGSATCCRPQSCKLQVSSCPALCTPIRADEWGMRRNDCCMRLELLHYHIPSRECAPAYFRRRYKHGLKALGGGQTFEEPISDDRVLDADQLNRFQRLPLTQQESLALKCNISRHQVLSALRDMIIAISTF